MARVTSEVSHHKTQGGSRAKADGTGGAEGTVDLGSLAVKADESPWTQEELDEVLTDLRGHRERLVAMLGVLEAEVNSLMRDAGDGAGHDQADVGATSFERDQELQLVTSERETLAQIDRALGHIEDGTFGVCEACSEPIGKMRVMAFPRATLCLPCKQRQERR